MAEAFSCTAVRVLKGPGGRVVGSRCMSSLGLPSSLHFFALVLLVSCGGGSGNTPVAPPESTPRSTAPAGSSPTPVTAPTPTAPPGPVASGDLELGFGDGGVATVDFSGERDVPRILLTHADGRIVVAGSSLDSDGGSVCALARLEPNGSRDKWFGSDGVVEIQPAEHLTDCVAESCVISCEVLVARQSDTYLGAARVFSEASVPRERWAMLRLDGTGMLDRAYGDGGVAITENDDIVHADLPAAAIGVDDRLVVGGTIRRTGREPPLEPAVRRYRLDGRLDTSFGLGGTAGFSPLANDLRILHLVVTGDLEVLLSGFGTILSTYPVLGRLTSAGEGDPAFGDGGWAVFPPSSGPHGPAGLPVLLPDQSTALVEGRSGAQRIVRLDRDGRADAGFGEQGVVALDAASAGTSSLLAQLHGLLVLAWQAADGTVIVQRRTQTGELDPSFGRAGGAIVTFTQGNEFTPTAIAVLDDAAVLVAGALRRAGACQQCSVFAVLRIVG